MGLIIHNEKIDESVASKLVDISPSKLFLMMAESFR